MQVILMKVDAKVQDQDCQILSGYPEKTGGGGQIDLRDANVLNS